MTPMAILSHPARTYLRDAGRRLASWLQRGWPLLVILAVVALAFGGVLLSGRVYYPGDAARQYLPQRAALARALAAGRLPWWTPEAAAGYPLLAEGEVGALYPPNWATVGLLSPEVGLTVSIVLHYLIAAAGAGLYLRSLRLSWPAVAVGTLALTMGGFYVAHLSHLGILHVVAWLPWLLYLTETMFRRAIAPRALLVRMIALAVVVALQFLAGHAQISLLAMGLVGLYALFAALAEGRPGRRWEVWAAWLGGVAMGAALAGPQLWASAQLTALSQRAGGLEDAFFTSYSFHPLLSVTMLAPFARGNPYPLGSVELMPYAGLVPVALAGVAVLRSPRRGKWFFLALALLGLLLAAGRWNPLYAYLTRIPILNLFRVPARYLLWTHIGLVGLSALGMEALLGASPRRPASAVTWAVAGALAMCVILVAGTTLALSGEVDRLVSAWQSFPFLLAVAAGAAVGLLWHGHPRWGVAGVLVLLLVDLLSYGAVLRGTYNATWPREAVMEQPLALEVLAEEEGLYRVYTKEEILPALTVQRQALYPNMAMTHGLDSANVYLPLVPQAYQEYLEGLTAARLDRLNVRYYLIPQLLPVDEASELYDVQNPFAALPVDRWLDIPETPVSRLVVESYLSHSTHLPDGTLAAEFVVRDAEGVEIALPLRVGEATAEWAYDREDVRAQVAHTKPPVASSWPARSGFPPADHPGYTYRASFALPEGSRVGAVQLRLRLPEAFVRLERVRLIGEEGEGLLSHLLGRGDHRIVFRSEDVLIYRNEDAWPRAYLVPRERGLLGTDGLRLDRGLRAEDLHPVEVEGYAPTHVVLSTGAASAGYLVLADLDYPGWRAWVDGQPAPIITVDGLFRAVELPTGDHRVEFRYLPLRS
ncbi:MAG: YfhO family protein [Chloroflexi bacterium]|nr:YfhO family protein [Chloroflexota bacterium]